MRIAKKKSNEKNEPGTDITGEAGRKERGKSTEAGKAGERVEGKAGKPEGEGEGEKVKEEIHDAVEIL